MEAVALKNLGQKLNIDMGRYQKCPTKEDALAIFNYIINIIALNENVRHSVEDIYRTVNAILTRLKSPVKVYQGEFLKPNQTTYIAIRLLAVHAYKMQLISLHDLFDEGQTMIKPFEEAKQSTDIITASMRAVDEKLPQLTVDFNFEENALIKDTRFWEDKEEKQKEMIATFNDIQTKADLLTEQIKDAKNKYDMLRALVDRENEKYRKLKSYESKLWKRQELKDAISKETVMPCVEEEEDQTQILDILKKQNENIVQYCYLIADSDSVSDDIFNNQRKMCALKKQIEDLKVTKEELDADNTNRGNLQELGNQMDESKSVKETLSENCASLYGNLHIIQSDCIQMEAVFKHTGNMLRRHNIECQNCIDRYMLAYINNDELR